MHRFKVQSTLLSVSWRETRSLLAAALILPAAAFALPNGFEAKTIASGLDAVTLEVAPDGRVFFTEKRGRIRVVKNDQLLSTPFADISSKVDNSREKGLLGLTLDPDFAQNGFVYAFYVNKNNNCYVVRWTAQGDVGANETQIIDLDKSGDVNFHHGGDVGFGADGKLYITRGNRQNVGLSGNSKSIFGKLLRINKDGTIPEDNPWYAENSGNARANWATGLRNSFSIAVQPGTGKMYFGDVADGASDDEINEAKKGAGYGYGGGGSTGSLFKQGGGGGSAMMGGVFYAKKKASDHLSFPAEYHGKYFFGCFGGKSIRVLNGGSATGFDATESGPIDFDIGDQGSLYFVTRTTQVQDSNGKLVKVTYPAGRVPVRVADGGLHPRGVMGWKAAGGRVEVDLYRAGAQTLELATLDGRQVGRLEAAGPGPVGLSAAGSRGLHVLRWQGGGERSVAKVMLP